MPRIYFQKWIINANIYLRFLPLAIERSSVEIIYGKQFQNLFNFFFQLHYICICGKLAKWHFHDCVLLCIIRIQPSIHPPLSWLLLVPFLHSKCPLSLWYHVYVFLSTYLHYLHERKLAMLFFLSCSFSFPLCNLFLTLSLNHKRPISSSMEMAIRLILFIHLFIYVFGRASLYKVACPGTQWHLLSLPPECWN